LIRYDLAPIAEKETVMRRLLVSLIVLGLSFVLVDHASSAPPTKGTFSAVGGSGISGKVTIHATKTGARISISVDGLTTDVEYIAVWSTTSACDVGTAPPDPTSVIGRFRGDKRGTASVTVETGVSADQIHSVAVQVGNGLAVVACASLQ